MNLSIRPLTTVADFRACEALQRKVWAMADDLEIVPLHLLVTVQRNGGLLLGAFDGAVLVAFVFGFPGISGNGKLVHCSHMMGVAPGYQSQGVGFQLKLAQRDQVAERGVELITWTYDPLESRNAHLNIHKLGCVCSKYVRDYYGPLSDGLSAGLPTDRFEVEWRIWSARVQGRLVGLSGTPGADAVEHVHAATRTAGGHLAPGRVNLESGARAIQFEIPANYQALKAADPALALEWRLAVREISEAYFAAGYTVADFLRQNTPDGWRSYYVLEAD